MNSELYKTICIGIIWLSCGIGLLREHSFMNLVMIVGAIYITHHLIGVKI